jgi:hypothetical protein
MPLVTLRQFACATSLELNEFEKSANSFWGTESPTNKEFLQTQAYRTFRIHVLLNLQRYKGNKYDSMPPVLCHLCDNYLLEFNNEQKHISLMRFSEH